MKSEVSHDIVAVGNENLVAAARISAFIQTEHTNTWVRPSLFSSNTTFFFFFFSFMLILCCSDIYCLLSMALP